MEKAREELKGRIRDAEQAKSKAEAQLEAAKKARAEADAEIKQANARADKAEKAAAEAERRAQATPKAEEVREESPSSKKPKKPKAVEEVREPPVVADKKEKPPTPLPKEKPKPETSVEDVKLKAETAKLKAAVAKHEETLQAARTVSAKQEKVIGESHLAFQRVLKKLTSVAGLSATAKKKAEELLGKGAGKDESTEDALARHEQSVPALEEWGEEICSGVDSIMKQGELLRQQSKLAASNQPKVVVQEQAPAEVPTPVVQEVVRADPKDAQEIMRLNKRLNAQQDEISRLLITIDELRARIEQVQEIATESSPEVATAIKATMKRAGLKEIIEAKNVPQLKGVFERLYQDSIQRIQRLGIIRERMLIANKAYSNVVNNLVSKPSNAALNPETMPDLDRLSSTAAATLSGMWYNTEFLFRNTCEYAIAQGVESSIMKSQKVSLSEVMDAASVNKGGINEPAYDDVNSPNYHARPRAGNRLPGRRGGDRNSKDYPGATTTGDGNAFWHPMPGGIDKPRSPRALRKERLADPEPSSFSSYVTAMREARGDLTPAEWPRCTLPERKAPRGDGMEFAPKTLKASISGGSRSLPALPKGRGMFQQVAAASLDA